MGNDELMNARWTCGVMGELKVGIGSEGKGQVSIGHDCGSKQGSGWWGGGKQGHRSPNI